MSLKIEGNAVAEWRNHWTVVFASAIGVAIGGLHVYTLGVFTGPLEQEFGWSRAEIASGLTIVSVLGVLFSGPVGILIDRFGPRRIGIMGVAALCCCVALLSIAGPEIWTWRALWGLLGVAALFIKPTVWTAAVSSLFTSGRGLALAVTLCGTGFTSTLTPIFAYWLIEQFGWRIAFLGIAGTWALIALPILYLFLTSAHDRRRTTPAARDEPPPAVLAGMSAREGLRSPRFFKLALGAFLAALVAVSFSVSMVPILSANGITRATAASLAGLVGMCSMIGRLGAGFLLDRMDGRMLAAVSVLMPILASLLLLTGHGSIWAAAGAAIILGLSLGAELDIVAYLATRHFGLRNFGLLFGFIAGLLSLATGLGPFLVGHVYDVSGSYTGALLAYMPLCLIAASMFLWIGPYPVFAKPEEVAAE